MNNKIDELILNKLAEVNGDVSQLRNNAAISEDAWVKMDTKFIEANRDALVGIADLKSRGLDFSLGSNGYAITELKYEEMSGELEASISMDGKAKADDNDPDFVMKTLPLPITSVAWEIGSRLLASSKNSGIPLDTIKATMGAVAMAEKSEEILFKGLSEKYSGNGIVGYTTSPNRATGSLTGDWASATPANILIDVLAMVQDSLDMKNTKGHILYLPLSYQTAMMTDYSVESGITIEERIKKIPQIIDVKYSANVVAEVLLVAMDEARVRTVTGALPTILSWSEGSKVSSEFYGFEILVPNIRDIAGQSAIVHYSE